MISVNMNPNILIPDIDQDVVLGIYCSGATIRWVQITAPAGYVTILAASASGWSAGNVGDVVTLTDGELASGYSQGININLHSANTDQPLSAWDVQVSENADGSSPFAADFNPGELDITIQTPVLITTAAAVTVDDDQATITWETDVPATSRVDLGPDTSYGTSGANSALVTEHSITIGGLSADTAYNFLVSSVAANGASVSSDDSTFSTAEEDSVPFATKTELAAFWRTLTDTEATRADVLLPMASNRLRLLAEDYDVDLDARLAASAPFKSTLQWVVMEAVKRAIATPTNTPPVDNYQQTAGPYSENYKFTNPSGDLWFKKSELEALGLGDNQSLSSISTSRTDIYGEDS